MEPNCRLKHDQINCPRYHQLIECRVGSINLCQCQGVVLNQAQRQYIDDQFTGCLCADCLLALRKQYNRLEYDRAITKILYGYDPPR